MITAAANQRADTSRALIIFAKQPAPGAVKTRLAPPLTPETAAELYACMLQDTLDMALHLAGITPFIFYQGGADAAGFFAAAAPGIAAEPQQGRDLGERMKRAFAAIAAAASAKLPSSAPTRPICRQSTFLPRSPSLRMSIRMWFSGLQLTGATICWQ